MYMSPGVIPPVAACPQSGGAFLSVGLLRVIKKGPSNWVYVLALHKQIGLNI